MPNNKSPWNNGVTKEFYEAFWDDLKIPLLLSVNKAFKVWELSTSQKWAVSKVIEKKEKAKRLTKNWTPILFSTLTQNWFQKFSWASKNCASNLFKSNSTFKKQVYKWRRTSDMWHIWGKRFVISLVKDFYKLILKKFLILQIKIFN